MKLLYKYISVLVLGLLILSCEDEDTLRIPQEFGKGPNVRIVVDPNNSFINVEDFSGSKLVYDLYSESKNLDKIELLVAYNEDGVFVDTVVIKSYTQADINAANGVLKGEQVSSQELASAFGVDVTDIAGGDYFVFINRTTMDDGTVYPSVTVGGNLNITPNIINSSNTTSFTSGFTVYAGCPSPKEDIEGTYTAEIVTQDSGGNPPFGLPDTNTLTGVTITWVGPEPFRYRVSSHDAGWWARPDITATEGGSADFFDICGTIIMQPKASFGFGAAADAGGGTYDPNTGVITLNWYNSFNDIYGFVTYTPE